MSGRQVGHRLSMMEEKIDAWFGVRVIAGDRELEEFKSAVQRLASAYDVDQFIVLIPVSARETMVLVSDVDRASAADLLLVAARQVAA